MVKTDAPTKTEGKEKLPPPVAAVERLVAEIEAEAPPQTAVAKIKGEEPLVPLTAEEVAAKVEQIVPRVKEVGLRAPLRALFTTYAKQVTSVLDGVLGAFDDGPPKKKG